MHFRRAFESDRQLLASNRMPEETCMNGFPRESGKTMTIERRRHQALIDTLTLAMLVRVAFNNVVFCFGFGE